MFQFLRGIVWEMTRPTVLGGGDPAIGPKILIRFAIMAKSVPKQLVTRLKTLVTRFFWHRLSRLSKFYFPAPREVASSRPAGKSNLDSREVFLCTRRLIVVLFFALAAVIVIFH